MIYAVISAAVAIFGVIYARWPLKFLERKYLYEEVPTDAIRSARVVGIALAVIGAVSMVYNLVRLL